MMISTSRNAIFLAALKNASTSIEHDLHTFFEILLNETPYGKHMSFRLMEKRFDWLLKVKPISDYFVFGVMRDPVDWILSLYNSHQADRFDPYPDISTKGMSIEQFLTEWRMRHRWQMIPQKKMFTDKKGLIAVNYLIDFAKLPEQLGVVCDRLGIPQPKLSVQNVSPSILTRSDLSGAIIQRIYNSYADDYEIYEKCTGRFLK